MPVKTATNEHSVRRELLEFLQGSSAHAGFEDAVKDFPASCYAKKAESAPHSAWQLVEHIRLTLQDLLEFCTNPDYRAPSWPEEYWPREEGPNSDTEWDRSITSVRKQLKEFAALVQDPKTDLTAQIPWGEGQTILREVLLAGDHTSYHVGQLVLLRIQLGQWASSSP